MSENSNDAGMKFKTPFGILEEVYVRTAAKGRYTPTIHEFDDLVISNNLKPNEKRILFFIKKKTVNFWNTHVRMRRKDIQADLQLAKPQVLIAIRNLVESGYLLEKSDIDDYYFYGINPSKFPGIFILRSVNDHGHRINRNEKLSHGVIHRGMKKITTGYEKGTAWVLKSYPEDELTIRNLSAFETLKYILLKYTSLNSSSSIKAEKIFEICSKASNPEFLIKQFVQLMHKHPYTNRSIVEQIILAHHSGQDANGFPIRTNAVSYVISCWDSLKVHWQMLDYKVDMSADVILKRNEAYECIMDYPIENNVIEFKRQEK